MMDDLTTKEMMDLPAGRLLDGCMYMNILGGEVKTIGFIQIPGGKRYEERYADWAKLPKYSADIGAAFALLFKLHGNDVELKYMDTTVDWLCRLFLGYGSDEEAIGTADGHEDGAALAICRALIQRKEILK